MLVLPRMTPDSKWWNVEGFYLSPEGVGEEESDDGVGIIHGRNRQNASVGGNPADEQ
jgi:hypothetical protein